MFHFSHGKYPPPTTNKKQILFQKLRIPGSHVPMWTNCINHAYSAHSNMVIPPPQVKPGIGLEKLQRSHFLISALQILMSTAFLSVEESGPVET